MPFRLDVLLITFICFHNPIITNLARKEMVDIVITIPVSRFEVQLNYQRVIIRLYVWSRCPVGEHLFNCSRAFRAWLSAYVRHILHYAGYLACPDRRVNAASKFLVCFKIAPEHAQTVIQTVKVIVIVDTGRNLGKSIKIKKQNNQPFKRRTLSRQRPFYKGARGALSSPPF